MSAVAPPVSPARAVLPYQVVMAVIMGSIGGIIAVAAGEGVLSIAVLVGFMTLFGIATRNGVLLVARYQDLMRAGLDVVGAVRRGSVERLGP